MKKYKKLVILLIVLMFPALVKAASITISGPSTAVVGNTINVNVSLSAGDSWQMILNYDSSALQLVSGGGEAGGVNMVNTSVGNPSRSYTFRFKALKTGSSTVSISSYDVVDGDGNDLSCSVSNKSISVITQAQLEASYSKNNNLKSIVVEGFDVTPEFDKDVLEYSVTVPENTTEVDIKAYVADNTATVSGEGKVPVELGTNKISIIVKAQNGDEKTYYLTVDVKDSNPIEVTVDDEKYTVVKIAKTLKKPNAFTETNVTISDYEIPAFKNDTLDLILVGLKNADGDVNLFIYKDNEYTPYIELSFGSISIYLNKVIEVLDNYKKGTCKISGSKVDCLYKKKSDRYKIVYGINVVSSEEGYFLYDSVDKNLIKYDTTEVDKLNDKVEILTYVSIGLAGITFISLIIIISLICKKHKNKKVPTIDDISTTIEEVEINDETIQDDNNIIEEVDSDEDDSFLTEKEKKKKNRKKK